MKEMTETLGIKNIPTETGELILFRSNFVSKKMRFLDRLASTMFCKLVQGRDISVDVESLRKDIQALKADINDGRFGEDPENPVRQNTITACMMVIEPIEEKQKILQKLASTSDKITILSLCKDFKKIIAAEKNSSLSLLVEAWNKQNL